MDRVSPENRAKLNDPEAAAIGPEADVATFAASRVTTLLANGHHPTIALFVLLDVVLVAGYAYLLTLAVRRLKSNLTLLTKVPGAAPRTARNDSW